MRPGLMNGVWPPTIVLDFCLAGQEISAQDAYALQHLNLLSLLLSASAIRWLQYVEA